MNRTLIDQLKQLNPTEGEWYNDKLNDRISCDNSVLYKSIYGMPDDDTLITLAPTMRLEILAMAKEIEELRSILKEARDLLVMCTLIDKSDHCQKMVDNIDKYYK